LIFASATETVRSVVPFHEFEELRPRSIRPVSWPFLARRLLVHSAE